MGPKPQLCVFMLLIQISLAVWQHVTVIKGQALTLTCPMVNAHINHVDWKNPDEFIMFFNRKRVLRDKRYSINRLSQSEFTISISNITFKDGGIYTCSQYNRPTIEKKVKVTVLGLPRMTVTKHDGKTVIKCTSEANSPPPTISWQLDDGSEISAYAQQYHCEDKKYVSVDQLNVASAEKRVTVKCLVRHPALYSQPLMDFVKIGRTTAKTLSTPTTSSSPTAHARTTGYYSDVDTSSTDSSTAPANTKMFTSTVNHVPSTDLHLSTRKTFVSPGPTTVMSDAISNGTRAEGWTSVSETTQGAAPENSTLGNLTVTLTDPRTQTRGNSSLLVLLVTCLILCLVVIIIFFAIKLRRAHVMWKRENEESDPSEESSKSKSSQEDKNVPSQRRKGLFNTAFTQYVIEEPTTVTSVVNTGVMAATAIIKNGHTSQAQPLSQAGAKAELKETEL